MAIKGHTKIELRDVKKGTVEVVEKENMVTNAVQNLLDYLYKQNGYSNTNSTLFPIATKAMGGIYLFNNTLTESMNNTMLPSPLDARLTGHAGHAVSDGLLSTRGSLNISESGEITNGYKHVWDFSTSEANGTIASVALTHDVAGFHGYCYEPYLAANNGTSGDGSSTASGTYRGAGGIYVRNSFNDFFGIVDLDLTNGRITRIVKTSTTNIDIMTYLYRLNVANPVAGIISVSLENTESITIEDTAMTGTGIYWVSGDDGFWYGLYYYQSGFPTMVCKINKETHEYIPAVSATYDNSDLYRFDTGSQGRQNQAVVSNGRILIMMSTGSIFSVNASNLDDFYIIDDTACSSYNASQDKYIVKHPNGMIVTNGGILLSDGTVIKKEAASGYNIFSVLSSNTNGTYYFYSNDGLIVNQSLRYRSSSTSGGYTTVGGLYPNLQYLATINNLDSPVEKTAAKTMKITYTLTYA